MAEARTTTSGAIQIVTGDKPRLKLTGRLTLRDLPPLRDALYGLTGSATVDMTGLESFDTSVGWALVSRQKEIAADGGALTFDGTGPEADLLLDTVRDALPDPDPPSREARGLTAMLDNLGHWVAEAGAGFANTLRILGLFFHRLGRSLIRPREFRLTALVAHCEAVGLRAVPIVALLSFLIGVVLAFQGASQLQQFGAEVFVVELIAISILRELGILLTAIIVAGRTASAYTSAIGSMKMREEIDAMKTLGIDPADALIVPRVLALILMLPILGLIANVSGLIGGALMAWIELGISPELFRLRLIEGTDVSHVIVGMVKTPVFALVIGVIGCRDGLRVEGTAESLGRMTSTSVVAAVFAVIVIDAVFSIFFAQLGI